MKTQSPDAINPALIPQRTLRGGDKMPCIGMGTFGSDRFTPEQVADAVRGAAEVGFRLFDCASVYGNEHLIGPVFQDIMASGIKREELFITSKVWNDMHGHGDVLLSCAQTLKDLKLDYIDLYFVHWPFPNFHPKGAAPDYHNHDARPYIHEEYMETWHQMEKLVQAGLVRHIGTSNMTIPKLERRAQGLPHHALRQRDGAAPLLPAAGILPVLCGERHTAHRLLPHRFAHAAGQGQDAGRLRGH